MYTKNNNYLIVVIGPTAIGKTALAIDIAKHFKCEIVSCDSRQFYKEMRIGTAVPSPEELSQAPHHFIQNKSIDQSYSVGDFEREALETLEVLFKKNPIQVMVGGSGLYVNAVLEGLDDFPDIDPSIRESLNQELIDKGLPFLQEKLKQLDPIHYQKVALDNPQRVIRALEICLGTNQPYSSFLNKKQGKRNFTPIIIGLSADRQIMYDRINLRVDKMMQEGLLKEASDLFEYRSNNALQTVGYREIFNFLEGQCDLNKAIEDIKTNTRRFAKRQITWFKRTPEVHWFDYQTPKNQIFTTIEESLK
ncbi:tRNA (adenosine(37)-N6)-dimethylallyltransferase MiaA [Myroides sp. LJL116]